MLREREWTERPTSISSSSSADSGTSSDSGASSTSGVRFAKTLSGDSGISTTGPVAEVSWLEADDVDDDAWECASDASGEYEPLRLPPGGASSPPVPPPPPPPPRSLPRRKDLTRHLGLPRELSVSLAELAVRDVRVRRKELEMFAWMAESRPRNRGLWRRWTTGRKRRGKSPEVGSLPTNSGDQQPSMNTSLPDLARLRVDMNISTTSTPPTPSTPGRRRAAASPRLLRSALKKVQERALKATSRSPRTGEVPWPEEGTPTLISQAKRGSLDSPVLTTDRICPVTVLKESWAVESAPERPLPALLLPETPPRMVVRKARLPTPPPEDEASNSTDSHSCTISTNITLEEESPYMTMKAIRETFAKPIPPPRDGNSGSDPGYLDMDTIRRLVRANSDAAPKTPQVVPEVQRPLSEKCSCGTSQKAIPKELRPLIAEEC